MPEQCIAAICCARLRDALWARSLFFLPATPKPPWPACLAMPAFHTTTWLPAPPHPGCLQYGSLPKGTPQWNQTIATLLAGAVSYPGALPSPAQPSPAHPSPVLDPHVPPGTCGVGLPAWYCAAPSLRTLPCSAQPSPAPAPLATRSKTKHGRPDLQATLGLPR